MQLVVDLKNVVNVGDSLVNPFADTQTETEYKILVMLIRN